MTTAERRELRDDLKSEIEECDAELIGIREEIREAKERLTEAKKLRAELQAKWDELKTPR